MAIFDSPFYLVIKLLAYCVWCFVGLRLFQPAANWLPVRALAFGSARLLMGFFFGISIYFLGSLCLTVLGSGLPQNVITYLLVYIPIRWIEWSIMAAPIAVNPSGGTSWFLGWNARDRCWRFGGIGISCLADIPLIISLGGIIPTGRFMC